MTYIYILLFFTFILFIELLDMYLFGSSLIQQYHMVLEYIMNLLMVISQMEQQSKVFKKQTE